MTKDIKFPLSHLDKFNNTVEVSILIAQGKICIPYQSDAEKIGFYYGDETAHLYNDPIPFGDGFYIKWDGGIGAWVLNSGEISDWNMPCVTCGGTTEPLFTDYQCVSCKVDL